MSKIRIDKFLSECKICTRSEADKLIKAKRIYCNELLVTKKDEKIEPQRDLIRMDGKIVQYEPFQFFMMNKPVGVISATNDLEHQTVCDLISSPFEVFPVGRLDIDTEGLLLLTNDGELAHDLLSPRHHIEKTYYVEGMGPEITREQIQQFELGFDYGEKRNSKPANLELFSQQLGCFKANITITEGKFHQVKRMFQTFGQQVTYLKRIRMGTLLLDPELKPGEYRALSKEEIEQLNQNRK